RIARTRPPPAERSREPAAAEQRSAPSEARGKRLAGPTAGSRETSPATASADRTRTVPRDRTAPSSAGRCDSTRNARQTRLVSRLRPDTREPPAPRPRRDTPTTTDPDAPFAGQAVETPARAQRPEPAPPALWSATPVHSRMPTAATTHVATWASRRRCAPSPAPPRPTNRAGYPSSASGPSKRSALTSRESRRRPAPP